MKSNQSIIYFFFFILVFGGAFFIFHKFSFAAPDATVNTTIKISVCGNNTAEGGEMCDGSDLRVKSCTDLGFSSGTLSCSASCTFNTTNCTTSAEVTAQPTFTASTGGAYTLTNGGDSAKITLPAGFYTQDLQMQAFSYTNGFFSSTKPAPSGKNFIGKTYDFIFVNPDGETVSTLLQTATIVSTYIDSDVIGIDQSTLAPYKWGSGDASWQLISGATVDTTNKTVTFSTANFSSFALFGSQQQQQQQNNNNGGGVQQGGGGGTGFFLPPFGPRVPSLEDFTRIDLNRDGKINLIDLSILIYFYGERGAEFARYDFDGNSRVDFADISVMMFYWTGERYYRSIAS